MVPERAEVHEAPWIAAPVVLRVGRKRENCPGDLLRDAPLEQALVRLEGAGRIRLDFIACGFARLVVNRLEAVRAGLADLRAHILGYVELGLHLRVPPAPFVVAVARAMA